MPPDYLTSHFTPSGFKPKSGIDANHVTKTVNNLRERRNRNEATNMATHIDNALRTGIDPNGDQIPGLYESVNAAIPAAAQFKEMVKGFNKQFGGGLGSLDPRQTSEPIYGNYGTEPAPNQIPANAPSGPGMIPGGGTGRPPEATSGGIAPPGGDLASQEPDASLLDKVRDFNMSLSAHLTTGTQAAMARMDFLARAYARASRNPYLQKNIEVRLNTEIQQLKNFQGLVEKQQELIGGVVKEDLERRETLGNLYSSIEQGILGTAGDVDFSGDMSPEELQERFNTVLVKHPGAQEWISQLTAFYNGERIDPRMLIREGNKLKGQLEQLGAFSKERRSERRSTSSQPEGDVEAFREVLRPAAEAAGVPMEAFDKLSGEQLAELRTSITTMAGQEGVTSRHSQNLDYKYTTREQGKIDGFVKQYDSKVKKIEERLDYAFTTNELLEQARAGNPIAGEGAKTQIARLSGEVGVLTDQDVARFGGSKALTSRVEQYAQQAIDGTITEENLTYLQEVVGSITTALEDRMDGYAKDIGKRASKAQRRDGNPLMSEEEFFERVRADRPFAQEAGPEEPATAPQQTPPPEDMVTVINPGGQKVRIRAADLERALGSGYQQAE